MLFQSPKTYLVTGGTGFLGLHLIPLLLQNKSKVRVFVRSPPGKGEKIDDCNVEYVLGSITDFDAVNKACVGVDGIYHLAGLVIHSRLEEHKKKVYETNLDGTLNILKAAAQQKVKRVVYASSSGVIACSPYFKEHRDDVDPYCYDVVKGWPYYASKIESETKGKEFAEKNGIEFIMLRPSVMLGPGDVRFRSTHIIMQYLDGKVPITPTGGYSFVDVRDVALAFRTAMEKGEPGAGYFLTASSPSTSDFFSTLSRISGAPKPKLVVPSGILIPIVKGIDMFNRNVKGEWNSSMDPVRVEMSAHYWAASSLKAKKHLNFSPRDPHRTLDDTIKWIRKNRELYGHPEPQKKAKL